MPFYNSCCGYSLRKAVLIIAYVDVIAMFVLQLGRLAVVDFDQMAEEANRSLKELKFETQDNESKLIELAREIYNHTVKMMTAIMLLHIGVFLFLCFETWLWNTLINASKKGDTGRCEKWLWGRTISMILYFWILAFGIHSEVEFRWIEYLLLLVNLFRLYGILVVYKFKKELKATDGLERL